MCIRRYILVEYTFQELCCRSRKCPRGGERKSISQGCTYCPRPPPQRGRARERGPIDHPKLRSVDAVSKGVRVRTSTLDNTASAAETFTSRKGRNNRQSARLSNLGGDGCPLVCERAKNTLFRSEYSVSLRINNITNRLWSTDMYSRTSIPIIAVPDRLVRPHGSNARGGRAGAETPGKH